MSYPFSLKKKVISLRKHGYSIKEISLLLNIAKNTSSLWLRNVSLDDKAINRLKERKILGQYKALQTNLAKRESFKEKMKDTAFMILSNIKYDRSLCKLLCSIFFWTEGGKYTDSYVYFMNSDPKMIAVFMKLLRSSFLLDETKFRALIHVHDYHDQEQIKQFWSRVTKIPSSQFSKSYLKTNTKTRIRDGYKGCVRIRYYDSKIALELRSIYNVFADNLGVSVNW